MHCGYHSSILQAYYSEMEMDYYFVIFIIPRMSPSNFVKFVFMIYIEIYQRDTVQIWYMNTWLFYVQDRLKIHCDQIMYKRNCYYYWKCR